MNAGLLAIGLVGLLALRRARLSRESLVDLNPCHASTRNPEPKWLKTMAPAAKRQLTKARELARTFHGERGGGQVVELSKSERQLSRFAVVAGELTEYGYQPPEESKRGDYHWVHESGDRGFGQEPSRHKPLLAVDPRTKRPIIVAHRSPVRFDPKAGFVG